MNQIKRQDVFFTGLERDFHPLWDSFGI